MLEKRNLAESVDEAFRPPPLERRAGALGAFRAFSRRMADLQYGTIWRFLREELAPRTGDLLDVGCGSQIYRELIHTGLSYTGLDSTKSLEHFGYKSAETLYFEGPIWTIEGKRFQTIICTEVLEHVERPPEILNSIFEALSEDGLLLMTVPFSARWHFVPHDYWRFTPSGLKILLKDAGFERICVYARGNPITVAAYKLMSVILLLAGHRIGAAILLTLSPLAVPLLGLIIAVANLSLPFDFGEDCLGYSITARKPPGGQ